MAERVALVTGASSGFGLGVARGLQERGWRVHALLRDTVSAPPALAGMHLTQCDLSDEEQVARAAAGIERLDCLVNNAGYGLAGPLAGYSAAQMRRQLEVNLIAPALLVQALLPALERAQGMIINVSSVLGEIGMPMNSFYCASKFALEGFSEALFHELKPRGIRVALVKPGGYRTRFGRNLVMGEKTLREGSADAQKLATFLTMRSRMLAATGRDPAPVVATILRIAHMRNPPLHNRVGAEVRVARVLRRLLPERLLLAIVGKMNRRRMPEEGNA